MSMTRAELLARCRPVLEAAKNGKPVEDSFIELKSRLPDKSEKAARGIAGAANAAGGEQVIWLVGIDEKSHDVVGASKDELAAWYPGLNPCFDGPPPKLSMVENIHTDEGVVVAMVFETDETPYVVKSGQDTRDIPWREGNRTRSACRLELLRALTRATPLPVVDLLNAALSAEPDDSGKVCKIAFYAHLYVKPQTDKKVVFPRHDCTVHVEVPGTFPRTQFDEILLVDHTGRTVADDVSVEGPRSIYLIAYMGPVLDLYGQRAEVTVNLLPVNATHPVVIRKELILEIKPAPPKRLQPMDNNHDPWTPRPL